MSERDSGDLFRLLFERWREALPAANEWARTFEHALATQAAVGRTIELSVEAWRELAATPPGAGWTEKLKEHADRIQRQVATNVEAGSKAAADWPHYLEYLASLDATGWGALRSAADRGLGGGGSPFAGLLWDAYEATFGRAAGAPTFGPGRELNEKLLRAYEAWVEWIRTGTAYGELVGDTWRGAIERFLGELAAHGERGEAPETARALTELFMTVAEAVFVERYQAPEYVQAQARALEAGLRYREREAEVADAVLRLGHVPSRTELDAAHRRVYELKQELRALREEVRALREETRAARTAEEHEPAGAVADEPS